MSRMAPPWVRMGRIAVLLGFVGALMVPSVARAATTCIFNPAKHIVTISGDEDVLVVRSGDVIAFTSNPPGPPTPCLDAGATTPATVHNTDLVKVTLTGGAFLFLDQIEGPFRPGFTNEPGTSDEIEVSMNLGRLFLRGTGGGDHIVLGRNGLNLNADEPDDDLDVSGVAEVPHIGGDAGNDIITMRGGSATGPGTDPEITILGGDGNDRILAHHVPPGDVLVPIGPHTTIDGGDGNDRIEGSALEDDLTGGSGNDYIDGGEFTDTMDGEDGNNTVAFKLENVSVDVDLASNSASPGDDTEDIPNSTGGDTVTYAARTSGLTVDIDGTADDAGENDDVELDVENLIGGAGGDTLTGSPSANILTGGSGTAADTLSGSGGNDTMRGGDGTNTGPDGGDTFSGGPNTDTVSYATRTGAVSADLDAIVGDDVDGDGDSLAADIENLTGGSAADTLAGNTLANVLDGGAGSDVLAGGTSPGADGADIFIAGAQSTGGDSVSYDFRTDPINASIGGAADVDGDDIQSAIDNIAGGEADDVLIGDADPNRLIGDRGDDTFSGGTGPGADGADDFLGGPHDTNGDTVSYSTRTEDIDVDLDDVDDDGDATNCPGVGCEADDIRIDIENVTGGAGDDDLTGDADANILNGGPGDDDFTASNSTGPDGADTFIGGTDGTVGGQNLEREDRLFFSERLDPLTIDIGGGANDTDGDDVRDDIESIFGGEGNDTLTGDGDANSIDGRQGDDTLRGGPGSGPDGADFLIGGTGLDTLTYAARTDDLVIDLTLGTGPDGDDVTLAPEIVIGGSGDDNMTGDASANTLEGGPGSDDLFGLAGNDTLDVRDGGPDTADCGDDIDVGIADTLNQDDLTDCETADTLPNTQITKRPNDRLAKRTATYEFESADASLFECKIDAKPFRSCVSPKKFRRLNLGRHVVLIRAVDAEGDKDPTPAKDRFKVVSG